MKKQYINPNVFVAGPEFDLDLMIPVGSKPVDDGFAKERDGFEEELEEEEFFEQIQQAEQNKKTLL
jgi:hypothetical protein